MAYATIEGSGLWIPATQLQLLSLGSSTYLIDATGEKTVLIWECPRAGDLDRFDLLIGTVANSPDNGLRASFQGVDGSGNNDGTILGATNNAFVTYAHTVTTGWKSTNFGEVVTVTRGQKIALVVDIPSFTAGDSVTISHLDPTVALGLPYGLSATGSRQFSGLPILVPHYTDGYAPIAEWYPAVDSVNTVAYHVNTAVADEWGLALQLEGPIKLDALLARLVVTAAGDFEVVVYDAADTILGGGAATYDGDVFSAAGSTRFCRLQTKSITELAANTLYRITIRPTTTNSVTLAYWTFNSAALMQGTVAGGDNFYMTSRVNQAGAWTNYNNVTDGFRRPVMYLGASAISDGAGGGGGDTGGLRRFNAGFN